LIRFCLKIFAFKANEDYSISILDLVEVLLLDEFIQGYRSFLAGINKIGLIDLTASMYANMRFHLANVKKIIFSHINPVTN